MIEHWYITVAACLDWQRICGIDPPQDDGPVFDRAAKELDELCQSLDRERHYKKLSSGDTEEWVAKTTIRGKRVRVEIYVRTSPREEGDAPQVVRVRRK
jgi:hypothetical protein